jgi:uncharacterized protein (DUF1697 family)
MVDLRTIADDCGFGSAKTYLQSGNIVLPATSETPIRVAEILRVAIAEASAMDIPALARSASDWGQVLADNPFRTEAADGTKVHVVFLEPAMTTEVRELDLHRFVPERMVVSAMDDGIPARLGESRSSSNARTNGNFNSPRPISGRCSRAAPELTSVGSGDQPDA